jgi:hypothetical protein
MTFLPSRSLQSFIPNDLIIPDNAKEANLVLTDYFRNVIDALNDKTIGQYSTTQTVSGEKWFTVGNANSQRFAYRKVINFGALPNAAATAVAHGITTTQNTVFTHIYGTATDPGATTITSAIPIPLADPAVLANAIRIEVDATNVTVTTAANYSAYTVCYIVLEYIIN